MTSPVLVAELQHFMQRLNAAWLARRFDELTGFFHPDAVILAPDFTTRVAGRDACIGSYRDFVAAATVHSFEDGAADVDVVGSTAMIVAPYTIDYAIPSGRWRASGRDVLVLEQAAGDWLVLWRLALPAEEVPVLEPGA